MTRARMPRPHEVAAARRDPRLLKAVRERQIDTAWRTRGACQAVDPETFFPAPSEPADAAVAMCRTCDVQGACLAWALEAGDCHGVWGATTPRERRAMLIAWRHEDEDTPVEHPERRLETMPRGDGAEPLDLTAVDVQSIVALERITTADLIAERLDQLAVPTGDPVGAAAG